MKYAKRDITIFREVISGATLKASASKHDISIERARQIIHRLRRKLSHPKRLNKPVPKHDEWTLTGLRGEKEFWLRQLQKFYEEAEALQQTVRPDVK